MTTTRRKGIRRADVRDVVDRLPPEISTTDNDKAVRTIVRWAARNNLGIDAIRDACGILGLDATGAVRRAAAREGTKTNFNRCPYCRTELRTGRRKKRTRMIAIEITDIYDGALFFACPDCGKTFNFWNPDTEADLYQAAEKHRNQYVQCTNTSGGKR